MPMPTTSSFRPQDLRRPAGLTGFRSPAPAANVRPEAFEEPASWSHPARDAARRCRVPAWVLAADLA